MGEFDESDDRGTTVELLVMRHAKSDWSLGLTDFARPLNPRGIEAADRMAEWLAEQSLCPDRIISSSAERTRSTAQAVIGECGVDRSHVDFERELYHARAETWIERLAGETAARILICGHNPALDELVDGLASTRPALTSSGKLMTTAAIAHFSIAGGWAALPAGTHQLVDLVRPREL